MNLFGHLMRNVDLSLPMLMHEATGIINAMVAGIHGTLFLHLAKQINKQWTIQMLVVTR